MPSTREPLIIGPFAGGLNTYDDPTAVRDTELVEALNWDPGLEGSLRSRPPFSIHSPALGSPSIKFLGIYYPLGNAPLLIFTNETATFYYDGTGNTNIATFAASAMVQFDNKVWLLAPVGSASNGGYWSLGNAFTADSNMPKGETITAHKSRLWVGPGKGSPNGSRVYYSKVLGQPNFWQTPSFVDIGQGDGQDIVLLTTYYDTLVAFRTQSIYNFAFTSDPAQGQVRLLVPNVGLASKDSLVSYENYLYFMYDEKAYQFVNNNASQINIKVPFTAVNKAGIGVPFSVSLFNNRAIFHYYDTMYVYSLRTQTWTRWRSPRYGAISQLMSPLGVEADFAYAMHSRIPQVEVYSQSFETDLDNYAIYGTIPTASITRFATGQSGAWSLRARDTVLNRAFFVQKTISGLIPGRTYTLSAWQRVSVSGLTAANVSVRVVGLSGSSWTAAGTTWGERTYTFVATRTEHDILLGQQFSTVGSDGNDGVFWDSITITQQVGLNILSIRDSVGNATESFECVIQTKNYNYQNSSNFKKLFWWGVDAVFRTRVRGWAVPVVQRSTVTWGQLRTLGITWGALRQGTWGLPLSTAGQEFTDYDLTGSGPARKFAKMFKTMRFRQIYFRLVFDTDGSLSTAPVNLFTITAYVATKETVTKAIS